MNIEQEAKLHLEFIEKFNLNRDGDKIFNWFADKLWRNNSSRLDTLIISPKRNPFGQWTDVREKYPDKAGDYLVYTSWDKWDILRFTKRTKFIDDDEFLDDKVTHWMPLPKP